jgi:hypothetical protein
LIFILPSLDLHRVIYLEILLGSDSFRSPSSTRIQLYPLLNRSCINLMFLYTKRSLTRSKEVFLSCTFLSCPTSLPKFFNWSSNSLLDFLPRRLPGFLPEIVSDSLPESLPVTLLELLPESYPSVLLGALPESYPDMYPIGLIQPYPSAYPTG